MNIFGRIILIIMLATVFVPASYLAWRAGQPMDLPQFHGLTYYQYLKWRKDALHQMAVEYRASHPTAKMGGGLDMCYYVDVTGDLAITLPLTGFYTLSGAFPNLQKFVASYDRGYIPRNMTLLTFMPTWWLTFEKLTWYMAKLAPQTSVAYCRLQPNIPTSVAADP